MNEVLSTLTGVRVDDPRKVIDSGFNPNTQGCTIKAIEVHSLCHGIVIEIGCDPKMNTWCITVEVNSQQWVRYCNLASYKVTLNQTVNKSDFLGYAYKGLMRLEYCTDEVTTYPVRIQMMEMYKRDPSPIIFAKTSILKEV